MAAPRAHAGAELVHTKGTCGASTRPMAPDVSLALSLGMTTAPARGLDHAWSYVSPYSQAAVIFFWFWIHAASAPSTAGTSTGGSAVIRKPRSAWFEGTLANGRWENGKRIHMKLNQRDIEQNTHQETQSMDEEHTHGIIISFFYW